MKYSIVIPCYNEAENINKLIEKIVPLQSQYDLEYILVENGSKDNSKDYLKKNIEDKYMNLRIVYVENNLGYGYGIQQGLKIARGQYVGWIHADLQVSPEHLVEFFDEIDKHLSTEKLFLKGLRSNRSVMDYIFTYGQTIFETILFHAIIHDVGAVPVVFSRQLLDDIVIDDVANDFSIELFFYHEAINKKYKIIRKKVKLLNREKGNSSWNTGLMSKVRQSKRIIKDSLDIKKGEKVL